MRLNFTNKFGTLSLELVSSVGPIKGIRGANLPDGCKFDIDIAERVVLISDNRGIQIGVMKDLRCYIIVHESPSNGAVARIKAMKFVGGNATQEIERARNCAIGV